jgi:hypothetical protein
MCVCVCVCVAEGAWSYRWESKQGCLHAYVTVTAPLDGGGFSHTLACHCVPLPHAGSMCQILLHTLFVVTCSAPTCTTASSRHASTNATADSLHLRRLQFAACHSPLQPTTVHKNLQLHGLLL